MTRTIYFITNNKSKYAEAKSVVENLNMNLNANLNIRLVRKELRLDEKRTTDQKEVVVDKARQAFNKLRKPVLVDDTAIYFDAYQNFPGTYTKTLFRMIGFKGIEKLLAGTSRKAHFKTMLCYKDEQSLKWNGRIIREISRKYNPDWEYNSIFVPEGCNRPLSEMSINERARISHRKKALDKFAGFLKKEKTLMQPERLEAAEQLCEAI
jgi:XTP/dITP diphosphohydrolase